MRPIENMQKALAMLGPSYRLTGMQKIAARLLEEGIADVTDESVLDVQTWAARMKDKADDQGAQETLDAIDDASMRGAL